MKLCFSFIQIYDSGVKKIKVCFYRAKGVKIGENFKFSKHSYIDLHRPGYIEIGDNVQITRWAMILCYDSSKDKYPFNCILNKDPYGKVKIGNNVYLGAHSMIMPGVTIGDNVIVAANSVVTHDIGSNSIVAGVPAKIISAFDFKGAV
jgi:maltose O-acetyltransferase